MDRKLFFRSMATQALFVGVLFAILVALPLDEDFFKDNGYWTGPAAWLACSIASARALPIPAGVVLFAAVAGGVAGGLVGLVGGHSVGLGISLLVFAASCGSYDPERDAEEERQRNTTSSSSTR